MSGTRTGGMKAAAKNRASDPDFYRRIGSLGGKNGTTGGFASDKVGADGLTGWERARRVGAIGGTKSRRKPRRCRACLSQGVKLTNGLCGVCEPMDTPELRAVLDMPTYVPVRDEGTEQRVSVRRPTNN